MVQLSSCGVRIFLGEVRTVLLVVENNEEHVVSSACVVPISTGGNTWEGSRTPPTPSGKIELWVVKPKLLKLFFLNGFNRVIRLWIHGI